MLSRKTISTIAALFVLSGIHSSAIAAAVAAAFIDSHTAHVLNHADVEGYCIGGSDDENDIWYSSSFTLYCELYDLNDTIFDQNEDSDSVMGANTIDVPVLDQLRVEQAGGVARTIAYTIIWYYDEIDDSAECAIGVINGNGQLGCS